MPRKKDVSRIEAGGKDERRCKERKKERTKRRKEKEGKNIRQRKKNRKGCLLIHSAMTHLLLPFFSSSNVFDDVKKSSDKIWRYRYYYLVEEYKEQPELAPPFVVVIHLFEVFKWMARNRCRSGQVTRKC